MNLQQIEYIIAVHELKNFGQAANRCFVTQSTLSTMIARFEEEFGVTLFDRKTKPVRTTQEGEQVIRQLKVISEELGNLQDVVSTIKGEGGGEIRIGVIPTIAPYLLPLFINNFTRSYPQTHFVFSEITTEKIIELIEQRDLDIGIVSIPLAHPEIREVELYDEPFLLFDRKDKGKREYFDISDIDVNRLWLLEEGHCMRKQVEQICGLRKNRKLTRNLDYKSGTIDTLMKLVKRNNGITLLPYLASLDLPESQKPYAKRFREPVPARKIGLIYHKHFAKKDMLNLLRTEIQERVGPYVNKYEAVRSIIKPI